MTSKLLALFILVPIMVTVVLSIDFIQAGDRGVTTHFAAVNLDEIPRHSGWQWKIPFQDNIEKISVQTQKFPQQEEMMFDSSDAEPKGIRITGTSSDIQDVFLEGAVIYHLDGDQIDTLYVKIGKDYRTEIVEPIFKQVAKQSMAEFTAVDQVQKREQLKNIILDKFKTKMANLEQCKNCIIVEDVAITDISFSDDFSNAIEQKQVAEQDALKATNIVKIKEAEAQQRIATAKGEAQANIEKALGEAEAVRIINEALANNPNYIQWLATQKWNGQVPYVTGSGATPLINLPVPTP